MHCPQCGQQQVSGELRFCSRCGFPLGGVSELLATGGQLVTSPSTAPRKRSPRYEGIRQGVTLVFIGAIVVPLLGIINSFQVNGSMLDILVPISAILFFVGGFMRILYAAIFEEGTPQFQAQNTALPYASPPPAVAPQLNAGMRGTALPPAQSIPVATWRQRPNTAEMVSPPSVTEHTTRLLDDPPERS
ncbi:MAG: hypothetical protein QOF02_2259 [Blastocatellia bacterium]|jgi:hypothetical protein|nr:hypothetical protein [Blastocatellia bacterium]